MSNSLRRYAVFSGQIYYPSGGAKDYLRSFADQRHALLAAMVELRALGVLSFANILDCHTGVMIWEASYRVGGLNVSHHNDAISKLSTIMEKENPDVFKI